ncbi:exonuclease 3'-5' domain-containing protein 2-like isoform X2 [Macrosteles quadrilineatus]|nr:exonuclease 3'-5' domain-containing protein 2-like isoform X2 [Macrosteles quadrilineatus]
MRKLFWKLRGIKTFEVYKPKHEPVIVSSVSEVKIGVETLRRKINEKQMWILGMDCEWVSTGKRRHRVALLQLAAPDGFCSLFRLSSLNDIPRDLEELLEDRTILKVGVAVIADARYLYADYGVKCVSCLDLRHLAKQVDVDPKGLSRLAQDLLGVKLDKDWRVSCSDWEAESLTARQIEYASADACVAVDIFNKLNNKAICKKFSLWKRMFWSKEEFWQHTLELWTPYVGDNFKDKPRGNGEGGGTASARRNKPGSGQTKVSKRHYSMMLQQEHYSNILLLAPDSQVLSTISQAKADWYKEKELVTVIDEKTLKLKFEPSKRSTDPDHYYTKPKENRCVVCGTREELRRKNIVPIEYKRYFQDDMKNHHSHDVLLMCYNCHNRSNIHDQDLKERLVNECGAPLAEGDNKKAQEVPRLRAIRSAARALYYFGDVIPVQRRTELEQVLLNELQVPSEQLTKEFFKSLINIECVVENESYQPHGLAVVQHFYKTTDGIEALERRWRQHFLDTMSPSYLPEKWSVNYVRD